MSLEKVLCTRCASVSSWLAATTDAGLPTATSSAWLGPVSTHVGRSPSDSARIPVGVMNVSISMPLVAVTTGTLPCSASSNFSATPRRNCVGTTLTASSTSLPPE